MLRLLFVVLVLSFEICVYVYNCNFCSIVYSYRESFMWTDEVPHNWVQLQLT